MSVLCCVTGADARPEADREHERAWNDFASRNREAKVLWGRIRGNPYATYGFEPIENRYDEQETVEDFLSANPALFGMRGPTDQETTATLGKGRVVYDCDPDAMEPLPGLLDDEWYEPNCSRIRMVVFPQSIDGVEFADGGVTAIFDSYDRLKAVVGEYIGTISKPPAAVVDINQAWQAVLAHLGWSEDAPMPSRSRLAYRFFEEIVPTWEFQLVSPDGEPMSAIVDADSGEVRSSGSAIDRFDSEPDSNDTWLWGFTLDDEAAHVCDEPAFRKRWADTSYKVSNKQGAFNPDIHVYDLEANPNYAAEDTNLIPRTANGTYIGAPALYYGCKKGTFSGDNCAQDRPFGLPTPSPTPPPIKTWDIATFTAYHNALAAYNYVTSLGFNKNLGRYAPYNKLVVIVNKNHKALFAEQLDIPEPTPTPIPSAKLCRELSCSNNSGFNNLGFPMIGASWESEAADNDFDYNNYWHGPSGISPFDIDDCVLGLCHLEEADDDDDYQYETWRPTIFVTGLRQYSDGFKTSHYKATGHPTLFHEFYHNVTRNFLDGSGYWTGGENPSPQFGTAERSAINEGFSQYFAASFENESPDNFYRSQLHCNSDETFSSGGDTYSTNLQYDEVFQCCSDPHDGGQVVTQILWDLREGIGVAQVGKTYTDALLVLTSAAFAGQVNTLEDLGALMLTIAATSGDDGLADDCPLYPRPEECVDAVRDAFMRHHVCVWTPCDAYFIPEDPDPPCQECAGMVCLRGNSVCGVADGIKRPSGGNCSTTRDELICCDSVCDNVANDELFDCASKNANLWSTVNSCKTDCRQNLLSQPCRDCLLNDLYYGGQNYIGCTVCDDLCF